MEKYKLGKIIGDGTFGQVIKGIDTQNGQVVAIKKMKNKYHKWEDCVSLQEIKSLMKFHHPNIIRIYEIIKHNNELHFVFEYMEQNIYQLMKERQKPFSEIMIRNIIYQTLQGLAYMHRHGYFHRDMKPENLLESNGTVKIADFGLAREIRSRPPYTEYVSTRWYRAPEVILRAQNYNSPIDIFAVGAIMAELFRLWPIFPGSSEKDQIVKICSVMGTPSRDEWPEGYKLAATVGFKFPKHNPQSLKQQIPTASNEAIDLIQQMLRYNPQKRPTAATALQHPFFQCNIPIPESVNMDKIVLEKDIDYDEEVEEKKLVDSQQFDDLISEILNEDKKEEKIKKKDKQQDSITSKSRSGYYMRNARYKPGYQFEKKTSF